MMALGIPKPIVITNGFYAITDNQHKIPLIDGRGTIGYSTYQFNGGGRFYSAFPPFHVSDFRRKGQTSTPLNTCPGYGNWSDCGDPSHV